MALRLSSHWLQACGNPEEWGGSCNIQGHRQSPIDLEQQEFAPLESLPLLLGGAYNRKVSLNRNDNGVITKLGADSAILDGGALDGTYAFLSLHFHFGSEHTVDGRRMEAEAHFVHYNLKYNPQDAGNYSDGLAVVGILIESGNDFDTSSDLLHKLVTGEQVGEVILRDAFPNDLEPWIRYDGSLTTPPCTENVLWTVILNPVTVPSLPKNPTSTFRPLQPLSNRTVHIRLRDTDAGTMLNYSLTNIILLGVLAQVLNQCQRIIL